MAGPWEAIRDHLRQQRTRITRAGMAYTAAMLAVATGAFTVAYLVWSGTDAGDFLVHHWRWGLLGAAITGAVLGRGISRQPVRVPRRGRWLVLALGWEGLVYGATEGLLLSVLPVLLVWQSAWLAGWRDGGAVAAGVLGLVDHHLRLGRYGTGVASWGHAHETISRHPHPGRAG